MHKLVLLIAFLPLVAEARVRSGRAKSHVTKPVEQDSPSTPLRDGKSLIGGRLGVGGAFDGALAVGINYEYLYTKEFGFGGQFFYSSYGADMTAGPIQASVSSKAYTFAALGHYHPSFIHVQNFDPYASLGIAHSFVKSEATVSGADVSVASLPGISVDSDSTFIVASLSGRYFFDDSLSVVGTLGLGLSTFILGMDYLF